MTFNSLQRGSHRASNVLYNYADTRAENPLTFEGLMDYYGWQITEELDVTYGVEEVDRDLPQIAKRMREAREIALNIYHECEAVSEEKDEDEIDEQAATRMQAHENEYVQKIGEALESGCWSLVAI